MDSYEKKKSLLFRFDFEISVFVGFNEIKLSKDSQREVYFSQFFFAKMKELLVFCLQIY